MPGQKNIGLLLVGLMLLSACGDGEIPPVEAEDHSHGGTAITIWTDETELFFEHSPMIAGGPGGPWAIHVTRLQDFSPITEGVLTLAFRAPDGAVFTTRSEAPARPGIYTPSPVLPSPGVYDLVVDINGPGLTDRIRSGEITVYRSEADIPHEEAAVDAAISFLKEQQWPIPFSTAKTQWRDIRASIGVSGEITPAAGRIAEVASPVSGLVLARDNLDAPAQGDLVSAGEVLITLAPTSQDNSYARAKADVERLTRERDRLQRLFDAEAIAEKRLIETQHDLEIARAAFEAMGGSADDGYGFPVRAPIAGTVHERLFIPGARIEIGQSLYRIVDPGLVWLKLRLPANQAAVSGTFHGAHFTVEGSDRIYETDRMVSIGSIIDPSTRTLPVLMAVENPDGSLKIGHVVQAQLHMEDLRSGVALPAGAILMEDGLPVAYVQTGGESFERRLLTLGPSDGFYTLVDQGIAEGEQVVTEGAYQVYLASLNTSEISDHGHPH